MSSQHLTVRNPAPGLLRPAPGTRPTVTEVASARLRMRPPTQNDWPFFREMYADTALWTHAPYSQPVSDDAIRDHFDALLHLWHDVGYDYWIAEDRSTGDPLGVAGVRAVEQKKAAVDLVVGAQRAAATVPHLNVYFRFARTAHGKGLGREAARAVTGWAMEHLPHLPVTAMCHRVNVASQATLRRAGLRHVGSMPDSSQPESQEVSLWWEAPTFTVLNTIDDELREQLLDLWCAVTDAGGAVGFIPGAARSAVAQVLDSNRDAMAEGSAVLGVLCDPSPDDAFPGRVVGMAWWLRAKPTLNTPDRHHVVKLSRAQVSPQARGRNLGNLLVHGMHGAASRWDGVSESLLSYRSGQFHAHFYGALGYREVGRLVNIMTVPQPDGTLRYFDEVMMMRSILQSG